MNINGNSPFLRIFFIILLLKPLTSLVMVTIVFYATDISVWSYGDFEFYKENHILGPNFLYGIFVSLIGAESLANIILVILASFISIITDTICVYIFIMNFKVTKLFFVMYLLFSLHPYFSYYTFKLDTMIFGKLACAVFLFKLLSHQAKGKFLNYTMLLMSMFRASSFIFIISIFLKNPKILFQKDKMHWGIILILTFTVIAINYAYFDMMLSSKKDFGWSVEYTKAKFGEFGTIIDITIHYLIKLFVLLGGREAVYVYKFAYFENATYPNLELLIFMIFALFHLMSLGAFILFSIKSKISAAVIISLLMLILSMFTFGHMRYLIVYYPFIMMGWLYIGSVERDL